MVLVPPDSTYLEYLDFQVLCLLFCLMAVIQGLDLLQMFQRLANWLLKHIHSLRGLYLVLVFLPFVSSMLLTNDVALLTFVPFALYLLRLVQAEKHKIFVVVLQTVAANIGSMLTPYREPAESVSLYRIRMGSAILPENHRAACLPKSPSYCCLAPFSCPSSRFMSRRRLPAAFLAFI